MVRWLMLDSTAMPYLPPLFRVMREMGATVAYAGNPTPKRFQALEAAGVECHPLRVRSKLDFLAWRRTRQLARAFKPDVVHSIGGRDAFVAVRARGKVHGHAIIARRGAFPFISPFDPVDRIVYGPRGVTCFATVSRALERFMAQRGIAQTRLRTVYTSIHSDDYRGEACDLHKEYGVPQGRFLFGLVANHRPVKGADLLWDALALLIKETDAFHVLVAGSGFGSRQRARLARMGIADHVTFLGHLRNIRRFSPNVGCVVFPSRIDALPRGAIEATLLGTPVLGTAVGGIPEILDHGRGGWLCEPLDPAALAAALGEVMDSTDERARRAAHAKERSRDLFSPERCARDYLQLYRDLQSR